MVYTKISNFTNIDLCAEQFCKTQQLIFKRMKAKILLTLLIINTNLMAQEKFKWLDKSEYPFSANYFQVNNLKLHYIDEGQGVVN